MSNTKLIAGDYIDNQSKEWNIVHKNFDYYTVSIDGVLIIDGVGFYMVESNESSIQGRVSGHNDFYRFNVDANFLTLYYRDNREKLLERKKLLDYN